MAADETYEATIKSLGRRRDQLSAEIKTLDDAIAILASVSLPSTVSHERTTAPASQTSPRTPGIYSLISIRWACLWILSQAGKVGLSTASVADLLEKGGRTSKAERFASSVSAVLSNMKAKAEVEPIGNYWVLTPSGHSALTAILPRLKDLADQNLKYTKDEIIGMPLSKSRMLIESNDADYNAACDYYFGGAAAVPNGPYSQD